MELRHLRYFVAVAEAPSFTKGAEKLHLAQPSLTRQIKDLGVRLLDRNQAASNADSGTAVAYKRTALLSCVLLKEDTCAAMRLPRDFCEP
jgi:Bacterial regulatory helix-turn-helix protein, lysR family